MSETDPVSFRENYVIELMFQENPVYPWYGILTYYENDAAQFSITAAGSTPEQLVKSLLTTLAMNQLDLSANVARLSSQDVGSTWYFCTE